MAWWQAEICAFLHSDADTGQSISAGCTVIDLTEGSETGNVEGSSDIDSEIEIIEESPDVDLEIKIIGWVNMYQDVCIVHM